RILLSQRPKTACGRFLDQERHDSGAIPVLHRPDRRSSKSASSRLNFGSILIGGGRAIRSLFFGGGRRPPRSASRTPSRTLLLLGGIGSIRAIGVSLS